MKSFVFILVAVACVSAYGGKNVNIQEDGTINVSCGDGRQISISKQIGLYGEPVVEIDVNAPYTIGKKIQVNANNQVRVSSSSSINQVDVLAQILGGFQGPIDEISYGILLNKVQNAVQQGLVNSAILQSLQGLSLAPQLGQNVWQQGLLSLGQPCQGLGCIWQGQNQQGLIGQGKNLQNVISQSWGVQVPQNWGVLGQNQASLGRQGLQNWIGKGQQGQQGWGGKGQKSWVGQAPGQQIWLGQQIPQSWIGGQGLQGLGGPSGQGIWSNVWSKPIWCQGLNCGGGIWNQGVQNLPLVQ